MYFIITNSDGDTLVTPLSKDQAQKYLDEEGNEDLNFVTRDELRNNGDTNYWGDRAVLLIEGNIVVPAAKKVVTKWSLEEEY